MRSGNRRYLPRLDMLRAIAAWLVLFHHCFTLIPASMLGDTSWAGSLNPIPVVMTAPWIPLTLFMVISGYSIGTGLAGRRIRWTGFLAARVLRVAPLYWTLLLIGIVVGAPTVAEILGVQRNIPRSLVQALLMMPVSTAYTPFPWLVTAWTVRIEVVLYLLVPAMIFVLLWTRPAVAVTAILGSCVAIIVTGLGLGADAFTVLYANVPGRLLEFSTGLLLAWLHGREVSRVNARRCGVVGGLLMVGMAYVSNHNGGHLGMPGDLRGLLYVGGIIAALLLVLWANSDHDHGTRLPARALVHLGRWSYSTYLWHFTVIALIAIPLSARMTRAWSLSTWPHLAIGTAITAALTVPLSYLSYRWIELPFLRLRPHYVVATPHRAEARGGSQELKTSPGTPGEN